MFNSTQESKNYHANFLQEKLRYFYKDEIHKHLKQLIKDIKGYYSVTFFMKICCCFFGFEVETQFLLSSVIYSNERNTDHACNIFFFF